MQATLGIAALKPFTRALTCLSKYGEEVTIHAQPNSLSLAAVNSSKTAYCRFKFDHDTFSKYRLTNPSPESGSSSSQIQEVSDVTVQLSTKGLLSILKHRTVEKSAERCELTIIEGDGQGEEGSEERDSLESKLIVKLHCKHGVVKTHRLLLQTPTSPIEPLLLQTPDDSRVTIGPKALKDMIEHFPVSKGAKSDPQLAWSFAEAEVTLRTSETSLESKGRGLSTELAISADEFDIYYIHSPPTAIAFHLREFNATIAFADSMNLSLEMRFTDATAPLFIDVEGDSFETIFVISTSQVHAVPGSTPSQNSAAGGGKKRGRDETTQETPRIKKSMKVVQALPLSSAPRSMPPPRSQSRPSNTMPPPTVIPRSTFNFSQPPVAESTHLSMAPPPVPVTPRRPPSPEPEPLFLPSSSQLSQAEVEVLRSTGLGIEEMNAEELEAMLEGDGEEVAFDFGSQSQSVRCELALEEMNQMQLDDNADSFDLELAPTQSSDSQNKDFLPLFED